jgi:hypothetical protein
MITEPRFRLVFSGRLQPSHSMEQVRQALRERFRLSDRQLDRLFSAQAVTVKRDLDAATAARYQQAFLEAGALVDLVAAESASAPNPEPSHEPSSNPSPNLSSNPSPNSSPNP